MSVPTKAVIMPLNTVAANSDHPVAQSVSKEQVIMVTAIEGAIWCPQAPTEYSLI